MRAFLFENALHVMQCAPPVSLANAAKAGRAATRYRLSMPVAALHPCSQPGCGALTDAARCSKHRAQAQREQDQRRGSAHQRGYGRAWQKASKAYLRAHPLCQCEACDDGCKRVTPASVVDHKVPHKGDMALFWDSSNWQSMSKPCHDRKTAREDGGFGSAG